MSDVLRTFTVRSPVVLSRREIELAGIQSHPAQYQSSRFQQWLALCRAGERRTLEPQILGFLRGPDSIKTIEDLGDPWSSLVASFLAHGPRIDKDLASGILRHVPADCVLGKSEGQRFFAVRTAVADTMLALAHVKRLGHRSNLDYQTVLRVLTFAERAFDLLGLPDSATRRHFGRPILLPPCFLRLEVRKDAGRNEAFPFLAEIEQEATRPAGNRGCKSDGRCTCTVNDDCLEQSRGCATILPYVADLIVVRDSTKCYQVGDLSFIRNVLAGETLSSKHRRLERTEEISETEEDRSRHLERDLQIDDKSALHKEISETVKSDLAIDAGVTANASWGAYSVSSNASFSYDKSKELSDKEVRDYSRNVVDRAISKLEEKLRTVAKTTRMVETEETNEHGFKNETGSNMSGQYLYVNKVVRAQVYNYGKKPVVDIYLPEPAALWVKLLEGKLDRVAPTAPQEIGVAPEQITPDDYKALAAQYGIKDVPAPPPFHKKVEVKLEGEPGDPKGKNKKSGSHTFDFNCAIPQDYAGVHMSVNVIRLNYNEGGGVSISATLAGGVVYHQDGGSSALSATLPAIEGNHNISVHTWDVTNFTWILTVDCDLKAEAKAQWQLEVYGKIEQAHAKEVEKYEKELAGYLEAKEEFEAKEAALKMERYNRNPFLNRETERTELKRLAISYISCQFFDRFDAMRNRVQPCGYPEMDIQDAEEQGRFIQFFEQAFNWNLMTYIFYRYFWGRKCTWADKLKEEANDPIFQQFLAAGSARVLVPIRDGYFDHVQYFLATGEIWGAAGTPPLPGDPQYVSLAQEMREQNGNFYADREGTLDVTNGSDVVALNGTDWYWTYADPFASPPVVAGVNQLNVGADIDREIIIDCKVYRIIDIQPNPAVATPMSWLITLERSYEGDTAQSSSGRPARCSSALPGSS